MRRIPSVCLAVAVLAAVAGCAASGPAPAPSTSATQTATKPPVSPSAATPTPTADPLAGLTLPQRVGQLFMVGSSVSAPTPATERAITERHAGSVFLHGRTRAGTDAVAGVVAAFTDLAVPGDADGPTGGIPLWVATDQEGGDVQVLRGPGFDNMPYAIRQADMTAAELRAGAARWGREMAAAGVDMNLAPVADIVTSHDARFSNPPIGALGRQYGYDGPTVQAKAGAFAEGMRDAGVYPVFKHFPGLGHVTENTDTNARVIDDTVSASSPDVEIYRPLTSAGPSAVMMSSAIYDEIDPSAPAVFSPDVVGVLREEVGFDGVILSDDLSAAAAAKPYAPADRAVLAIAAGVDVVLVSADPSVYPAMYDAVLDKAQADASFAALVDAAAARVVAAKAQQL